MNNVQTSGVSAAADYPVREFTHRQELKPACTYFRMFTDAKSTPFFRSTFAQGFWVFTDRDLILEAHQRPDLFSSTAVIETEPEPPYRWIPEMLDPPEHTAFRRLLGPQFSPTRMAQMEDRVRARCVELVEPLVDKGACDFLADFAQIYPTSIFLELMGLPVTELSTFLKWEGAILHTPLEQDPDRSKAMAAMGEVMAYMTETMAKRRQNPGDDLISYAAHAQIDGEPVSDDDLRSLFLLLFMAGLDTVTQQLAYSFLHLASHPDDRRTIVADPTLIPSAIEEFLRLYAIVVPSRKVMQDVDFHGCPLKAGDMVSLPLVAANTDERTFPDPLRVDIHRSPNPHLAFGGGPHRCLGSNLARREMVVALEEWHKRIPEYRLADGVPVMEHGGMMGLENLPILWGPASTTSR